MSGTPEGKGKGRVVKEGEGEVIDCLGVDNGHVLYIVLCGVTVEFQNKGKCGYCENVYFFSHSCFLSSVVYVVEGQST